MPPKRQLAAGGGAACKKTSRSGGGGPSMSDERVWCIKCPNGDKFQVLVPAAGTVAAIKRAIAVLRPVPYLAIDLFVAGVEDPLPDDMVVGRRTSQVRLANRAWRLWCHHHSRAIALSVAPSLPLHL
jgi:hypothetical protein